MENHKGTVTRKPVISDFELRLPAAGRDCRFKICNLKSQIYNLKSSGRPGGAFVFFRFGHQN